LRELNVVKHTFEPNRPNLDLQQDDIDDAFRTKLFEARKKAKRRTPTVWTPPTPEWPNGKPNRMPLFFACLEEVLGLKGKPQKKSTD